MVYAPEDTAGDSTGSAARLLVIRGPGLGSQFELNARELVIGRASDADIRLTSAGISRKHCRIEAYKQGFRVVDLDSTNKTRVNGQVVDKHRLADGDRIQLEQTVLKFIAADTAESRYFERVAQAADRDPQTGLHTLEYFQARLEAIVGQAAASPEAASGGVFHIALDRPAELREQTGVTGASRLLAALGQRIAERLGEDVWSARFGEFRLVTIIEGVEESGLEEVASGLRRSLAAEVVDLGDHEIALTASIGVCPFSLRIADAEAMLVRAARCADQAQEEGGNRCRVFEPEVLASHVRESDLGIVGLLREALKGNSIQVLFQPAVSTGDDDIVHYQLLPRLMTDDDQLIPAARFIPIAEANGLIIDLDRWMGKRAVEILSEHKDQGRRLRLFVSQSAESLNDTERYLALSRDLDPEWRRSRQLVFEFAGKHLTNHLKPARLLLPGLRKLGFGVSVVGVGVDPASEALLTHFPADFYKLDPRLAGSIGNSREISAQFDKLADQAHRAGAKIIIPHVEDAQTMSRLWRSRADLLQGYFIQQPMQTPDFSL